MEKMVRGYKISTLNGSDTTYDLSKLPFFEVDLLTKISGMLYSPLINHQLVGEMDAVKELAFQMYGAYRLCFIGSENEFNKFYKSLQNVDETNCIVNLNINTFIQEFPKSNVVTHIRFENENVLNDLKEYDFRILKVDCLNEKQSFFKNLVRNKKSIENDEGIGYDDLL